MTRRGPSRGRAHGVLLAVLVTAAVAALVGDAQAMAPDAAGPHLPPRAAVVYHGLRFGQLRDLSRRYQREAARREAVPRARRAAHWNPRIGSSVVRRATAWLGLPYSWAGGDYAGPSTGVCAGDGAQDDCWIWGFDCSGLVLYSLAPYEHLAHFARTQYASAGGFHPTRRELLPGDLVYYSRNGRTSGIGHTAIYVGHGTVVQAPESGHVVEVTPLDSVPREAGQYVGATRPLTGGWRLPGPRVSHLSAAGGLRAGGRRIVVRGRGFFDVVSVGFGTVDGRDVRVLNPRTLLVTVPAHSAATVPVTVRSGWGASRATAATTYTYSPPPAVATVTPSSGLRRGGGTIEITGSWFTETSRVRFGTVASRSVQVVSPGQLRAVVPPHAAGVLHVFVTTGVGTSRFTPANRYTYVAAGSSR